MKLKELERHLQEIRARGGQDETEIRVLIRDDKDSKELSNATIWQGLPHLVTR